MAANIIGVGSCLPDKIITNFDLMETMDTSDEWIKSRTGIASRHKIENENCIDLAYQAGQKALLDAGITAEELNLIIVATLTPDTKVPAMSFMLQDRLGATKAACFDLNSACTGFITALITANAYMEAGMADNVLIVGVEAISRILDYSDRSTGMLFGDGAGAAVVKNVKGKSFSCLQGAYGQLGSAIYCANTSDDRVVMDGRKVFEFAVRTVPEMINNLLKENEIDSESVDYFILHQANRRISDAVIKRLGITETKFPSTIEHTGNTSAASVPILLDECRKKGLFESGRKLVLAGFGGGLSYGTCCIDWR